MFKRLILFFVLLFGFLVQPVLAQESKVNIYFFWGEGCPHCSQEKPFLEELEKKYPQVKVYDFEVYRNSENSRLLQEVGEKLNIGIYGVPFTVIGEKHVTGWLNEEVTGGVIEDALKCNLNDGYRDVVGAILNPEEIPSDEKETKSCEEEKASVPNQINLPFIGKINPKDFSLPVLTFILGALDGFNPCAMWTLLFLISLLLGMKDKKRRWILGTVFIFASALVYFFFMAAWLNLLLFVGFLFWVRLIIGLVALGGGGYNLREYIVNKNSGCKVTGTKKRQAVFSKLKQITQQKAFFVALGGIILLAFAVNLVELICSAGLPVVFTQILTLSQLSRWQHYAYMFFYIFIFMLDDLIIFFTAMITLEITGMSTKYSRVSNLIGGILMLIIGLLLIFKPELLMFG